MVSRGSARLGRKGSTTREIITAFIILGFTITYGSVSWQQTSIIMGTYTANSNHTFYPPLSGKKKHSCKPIQASLVLFGVPKMFNYIMKSYVRNIVEQNPHVDFSVHLHMYHDLMTVNTPRNGERGAPAETSDSVLAITRSLMEDSPISFITSNQTVFDQSLSSWLGKSDTLFDYDMITTMNIFRQGHSMKNAFLSATGSILLEGSRILSQDIQPCGNSTVYLFLRSDTLLLSPITIPLTGLPSNNILLPTWEAWRGAAYNDRLALAGPFAAEIYAEVKSSGFKGMILDQKSQNASLVDLGTPERMLKSWIDKKGDQLNVTLLDDWAKLLRIRTDGAINGRDKAEFHIDANLNYVQNLSFAWTPV
jgi:hypothetical protein